MRLCCLHYVGCVYISYLCDIDLVVLALQFSLQNKYGYAKSIAIMRNHWQRFRRFYNFHLKVGLTLNIILPYSQIQSIVSKNLFNNQHPSIHPSQIRIYIFPGHRSSANHRIEQDKQANHRQGVQAAKGIKYLWLQVVFKL